MLKNDDKQTTYTDPTQNIHSEKLKNVRNMLARAVLWASAIIAIPALITSLMRAIDLGWENVLFLHISFTLAMWIILLFRKHFTYRGIAVSLIVISFCLSMGGVYTWGLQGVTPMGFVFAGIIAAIFFGARPALLVTGVGLVVLSIIAFLVSRGVITYDYDFAKFAASPSVWVAALFTIALYMGIALTALGKLQTSMNENIDSLIDRSQELKKTNEELEHRIAEKQQAEDSLKISEDNFRKIFEYAPEAYYIYDFWGVFIDGNHAAERLTGFHKSEVIGKNFIEAGLLNLDQFPLVLQALEKNLQGEPAGPVEYELTRKDGEKINIETHTVPIQLKDQTVVVGIVRDITQSKKAAQELRESEEKFRAIGDSALDAVILLDNKGETVYWNPAATKMFGYSAEEMIGKKVHDFVMPEKYSQQYQEAFLNFITTGEGKAVGKVIELTAQRKNKSEFPIEIALSPIRMQGEFWSTAIIRDISERKLAEEESARLTEQLQQAMKMEAVGRLAGGVAHDFNNLLTSIKGNLSLVLHDMNESDPLRETLTEVEKAAESASTLTRQLLAFSRRQIIEPKIVDLNELIHHMQKLLIRLVGEDIQFEFVSDRHLGQIKADPGQIEQILANLVVNARDAMPDGGKLTIHTSNTVLDSKYCEDRPSLLPGSFVKLSVSDTGCGMSPEVQSRLFEPFFTTKPVGKGTGLGLATIYGAVKQHNGFIEVASEEGHGTTFVIYLPRVTSQVTAIAPEQPKKKFIGGSETILLVEDDPMVHSLNLRLLQRLGYKVLSAIDGQKALALASSYMDKIDMLLTDVIMPGMNGRELAEKLAETHPTIKVLFTSGYTNDVIVDHGVLETGLNFIGKPYTPQALADKIRQVLESSH